MIRFFMVSVAALLLLSCGTARRTMKQAVAADTLHIASSSQMTATAVSEEAGDMQESVRVGEIVVRYDTGKPVSEHTGRPPVSEERVIVYASEKRASAASSTVAQRSVTADEQQASALRTSFETQETVRRRR